MGSTSRRVWFPRDDIHLLRFVRTVVAAGVASSFVYLLVLWDFRLHPLRSALGRRDFADFYDLQGRALLKGHLHVPRGSLGIEGFIEHGREYMYFPPGPALARLPILLVTHSLDGRLSAISMLLAWVATVVLLSLTAWRIRRILRGRAPLPQWEAAAWGCFVAAFCVGSVWLYLAAMPWVYHEAYAWAIATGLACTFTLLGVIERPTARRAVACGVALLCAVLTRATTGWAFGLAMLATAAWFLLGGHGFRAHRFGRLLLTCAALPLMLGITINWVKFSHPYEFRLEDQVWSSVNQHRRDALEANGGDLVSLKLLPSTLVNYFRPDGIRLISIPPFITFPAKPAHEFGPGFLDQTYRTGSAVPFMPGLVGLSTWGLVTTFRRRGPDQARLLRIPVLGAGAVCGAILIYGYISYRYLAELLPLFAIAGAVGLVDLGHLFLLRPPRHRQVFLAVLGALTLFAVWANTAVAVTTEKLANPGPSLDRYLGFQERVSDLLPGDPLVGVTTQSEDLPDRAEGEHLHIVGDCAALFVGQGDDNWPWIPAEVRTLAFTIVRPAAQGPGTDQPAPPRPGRIELAHRLGRLGGLSFETRADGAFRLVYESPEDLVVSDWSGMSATGVQIVVLADVGEDQYIVTADGSPILFLELSSFDASWFRVQNLLLPSPQRTAGDGRQDLTVRIDELPPPPRCQRLLDKLLD